MATGFVAGSVAPGVGNIVGAVGGLVGGVFYYFVTEVVEIEGQSAVEWAKKGMDWVADGIASLFS